VDYTSPGLTLRDVSDQPVGEACDWFGGGTGIHSTIRVMLSEHSVAKMGRHRATIGSSVRAACRS
jgi:hypothetical protein